MPLKRKGNATTATEIGARPGQEDCSAVVRLRRREDYRHGRVLAVMDGHGGPWTSEHCSQNLERVLLAASAQTDNVEDMLRRSIAILHSETKEHRSGCTISLCFVPTDAQEVTIATLGDSPVVTIDRDGAVRKSVAHNAGTHLEDREAAMQKGSPYYDDGRIRNKSGYGLQLTRCLGAEDFEELLSREPDVYVVTAPQAIVVCSDGVISHRDDTESSALKDLTSLMKTTRTAEVLMRKWVARHPPHDNATIVFWKRM